MTFNNLLAFNANNSYIGFYPVLITSPTSFFDNLDGEIYDIYLNYYRQIIVDDIKNLAINAKINITPDYRFSSNNFTRELNF
jgi:hypothetical protein